MVLITYYDPDFNVGFLPEDLNPGDYFLVGEYFSSFREAQTRIRRVLMSLQDLEPDTRIKIADAAAISLPHVPSTKTGVPTRARNAFQFTGKIARSGPVPMGPFIIYDLDTIFAKPVPII